jgi:type IV secretory pathway TraG/TraD family ATPase VirD4
VTFLAELSLPPYLAPSIATAFISAFWETTEHRQQATKHRKDNTARVRAQLRELISMRTAKLVSDDEFVAQREHFRRQLVTFQTKNEQEPLTEVETAELIRVLSDVVATWRTLRPQAANERQDFYCYVDEFPMFATASVDVILSEARKYRLCLILAMQYLDQLDPKLLGSVFGNVGNMVIFRVGAKDAAILERELAPVFSREDLLDLHFYHAYIRMMIDGKPAKPFSAMVLPAEELNGA